MRGKRGGVGKRGEATYTILCGNVWEYNINRKMWGMLGLGKELRSIDFIILHRIEK